jgi:hypothetical protein
LFFVSWFVRTSREIKCKNKNRETKTKEKQKAAIAADS